MNKGKLTSESLNSSKQPNADRRSFIWKTGAAMTAVIASSVAGASKSKVDQDAALKEQVDRLSNQLGLLEDANAIRRLHQSYEQHLDNHQYEEVVSLFADDAEVYFNGGLFAGRDKGVRRLYLDHFRQGLTGKKIEPAPGYQLDPAQQQDIVEVALDRKSASARFPYSMQAGAPDTSEYPMMELARRQGQGIIRWWEGGIYESSYVKDGDQWKIRRLDFHVLWQACYAPGLPYTKPISVPLFAKAYPEHPTGPDKLVPPEVVKA
jgi:hypothetical protein